MWLRHSRRIVPISFSAYAFCQGEPGAMGLSRMPMAHNRRVTAELAMQVVKNIRRATRRTKIQNFIYFVALVTARTSPTCRT